MFWQVTSRVEKNEQENDLLESNQTVRKANRCAVETQT